MWTKPLLEVSGCVICVRLMWQLRLMWFRLAEARSLAGHMMIGESKSRTQGTVTGSCIASCATLLWSQVFLIFTSLREAQQRTAFQVVLLTHADTAEAWWFLLDHATIADLCLVTYWTGLLYPDAIELDYLNPDRDWNYPQRTDSNQVHILSNLPPFLSYF
jgi:hypothetical protein